MKKIIDFFVAAYFSVVYKKLDETTRLENALIVLDFLFGLNGASLFFRILPIICSIPLIGNHLKFSSPFAGVFFIAMAAGLITLIINRFLKKYYSEQQSRYIKTISEKYPRVLLILFIFVHFLVSIFLFVYCMKYTLCLRP